MTKQTKRFIISGGGTGGHIFPAIAIADALRRRMPDAQIQFVGAKGRMEMQRVPQAGYAINGLWISGFQRSISLKNLLFPFKLIYSLFHAQRILKKFKPDLVIGVGGYASGPTLRAAVQLKIPTLIQEQNSFPGITNRLLASKVNVICTAYDRMDKWFPAEKTILTGNPLRKNAVQTAGKRKEALKFFGMDGSRPVVLIVGGSQGAMAINKAMAAKLDQMARSDIQLIWQTGKNYEADANQIVKQSNWKSCYVTPFIDRMDFAYAAADLVVSRAGAMAISELAVVQKAAIFVPLPSAAEDHQTSNARRLVQAGAAEMIANLEAADKLVPTMIALALDNEKCRQMQKAIAQFAMPDADEAIVDEIEKLLKQ
ncbi:MAG: undecaprenyldiphospho-muramoylpentapeptide beta-N-acetylglucosaminyltransferase [Bacteroidales bacterium]|jgi:UDP-N-acetylglucosamine--N-acetylmuramyl-(pentapeptide) pyrophosphoryl-undecaprenol N-acetylglucosamine transferase|nr:undecaprenyldiphospho-muramoylpentapeptide beta-N-acetylglucosaminyltransferase [Bacteroidales bacterium]MDN5349586.1 UDP-N-acetylglucosamine--N-acetylmuramyl-(pentapeptide) pyrophosphoryl-undecaprenol [Bacteroidales bacterium]